MACTTRIKKVLLMDRIVSRNWGNYSEDGSQLHNEPLNVT